MFDREASEVFKKYMHIATVVSVIVVATKIRHTAFNSRDQKHFLNLGGVDDFTFAGYILEIYRTEL